MNPARPWLTWWESTRPVHPETAAALRRRWAELPARSRTPAQILGKHAVGCEGTHGVFPRCNLACTPCYHSRDANRVATSGTHTLAKVREQMAMFRRLRGPRAHAQLIGGEVSLLDPDDHAATLLAMRDAGREPMSMSHGDFDPGYLESLVLDGEGRPRLDRVSFAGHFDMLMFGRRGIERPTDEASLDPYRRRFTQMFADLRVRHGVTSYLAHTMTVTDRNIDQIADVIRRNRTTGFDMFSFQPAAFIGDKRRWHDDYSQTTGDAVWSQIEKGVGCRLPFRALQHGDERCNRTTYGFYVGDTYHPLLDDLDPRDLRLRDVFLEHLGGVQNTNGAFGFGVKLARVAFRHPVVGLEFARWTFRAVRRTGIIALMRHGVRPVTFVMHSFMDAADVAPAWAAMQNGEEVSDERVKATRERLQACFYTMAHPETGELIPACVQHSILDPAENVALRRLLPITPADGRGRSEVPAAAHACVMLDA